MAQQTKQTKQAGAMVAKSAAKQAAPAAPAAPAAKQAAPAAPAAPAAKQAAPETVDTAVLVPTVAAAYLRQMGFTPYAQSGRTFWLVPGAPIGAAGVYVNSEKGRAGVKLYAASASKADRQGADTVGGKGSNTPAKCNFTVGGFKAVVSALLADGYVAAHGAYYAHAISADDKPAKVTQLPADVVARWAAAK